MPSTTSKGLPYPLAGDNPAVHTDIYNLAAGIDTLLDTYIGQNNLVSITFEGSTADSAETTLTVVDPSVDRTITLPDATGTVVLADATQTLSNKTLASPIFTGQVTGLELSFSQAIVFEGTTADSAELTLSAGEPTTDRTITLPNETGTLATQGYARTFSLMLGGM